MKSRRKRLDRENIETRLTRRQPMEAIAEEMIMTDHNIRAEIFSISYTEDENTRLERIRGMRDWDVSRVTNMNSLFLSFSTRDTDVSRMDLRNWDTRNVTTMRAMFHGLEAFNCPLNDWDTSNVTNMNGMFRRCKVFNQPLSRWDVSKVTDMQDMFFECRRFNQNLATWKTTSLVRMRRMFYNCKRFVQNISSWDTRNLPQMGGMDEAFAYCPIPEEYKPVYHDTPEDIHEYKQKRTLRAMESLNLTSKDTLSKFSMPRDTAELMQEYVAELKHHKVPFRAGTRRRKRFGRTI